MKTYVAIFFTVVCLCTVVSIAQDKASQRDNVVGDTDMRAAVTPLGAGLKIQETEFCRTNTDWKKTDSGARIVAN
jgi:hypothetical protein